ncbi:MAG: alpha-xylosidase [Lachnospiraceae bacterium]|nr:alpha-xylosidase [Lachnospiraceae bacterium]
MKFFNGHWEKQKGVTVYQPKEIYESAIREEELYFLAPDREIIGRGMTLDGVLLTFHVSVAGEGIFHIVAEHYQGIKKRGPEFSLALERQTIDCREENGKFILCSGKNELHIIKKPFSMEFYCEGRYMTRMETSDFGYIRTEDTGVLLYEEQAGPVYMRGATGLSVGEKIYGLGERFGPFVKNGQSIDMWNEDGGTSSDLSYKNVPFYLSDRGYGIFVNEPGRVSFEVGTERVEKVGFSVPGERLDFFYIGGSTMKESLGLYTGLTGRPALPPEWSFGLWLSTSFVTDYDEKTVMEILDRMQDAGIPLSVFHFDCFWMKGFHWCDFLWNEEIFPDPAGMLKRLHERGLRLCVWINPYIAQASALFQEGMEKGYFIQKTNGDVWQWDKWQAGMAIVDFTNPEAKAWYQARLEELLALGVDCFKTDFGERLPVQGVCYYDGSEPERMHNYYSYLYNETVFETVKKIKGEQDALVFARSGTSGSQQFPVHWGGDCFARYEAMAESLRGGLSLTMSGYGYWSHDIGGFEDTSSPDVYKRWVAFGLLSSHSRLHGSGSYRVPWLYGEEAVEVLRHFVKVKQNLMPYLLEKAKENHDTGIPLMRAMVLEFPGDMTCGTLDLQYMLGDRYLVAPVFDSSGTVTYYLPAGQWKHYFTGEQLQGPVWRTDTVDYFTLPLWERLC